MGWGSRGLLLVVWVSCTRGLHIDPRASVTLAEGTKLSDTYHRPILLTSGQG